MPDNSIMYQCPRFHFCSVPKCPLDLYQDKRTKLQEDPDCTMAKSIRMRIGKGSLLPYQGAKKKEWVAMKRWKEGNISKKFIEQKIKIQNKKIVLCHNP